MTHTLKLDGSINTNILVNASASINDLTTKTIVARIKLNTSTIVCDIFNKSSNTKRFFIKPIGNNDRIRYYERFSTQYGEWNSWTDTVVSNDTIYHYAITYDNSNLANIPTFYFDGISKNFFISVNPIGTPLADTDNLIIGDNLNGFIYEVAIFNIALSPTQITDLYNKTIKPSDIPGCVLYHDYTKGNALDLSGNNNNGTLQGGAQFIPIPCSVATKTVGESVTITTAPTGGSPPYTVVMNKDDLPITTPVSVPAGNQAAYSTPLTVADIGDHTFGVTITDQCTGNTTTDLCSVTVNAAPCTTITVGLTVV